MSTVYHNKVSNRHVTGIGDAPQTSAHFFYSSPVPIDDPLSVLPIPGSFEASFTKRSFRPFSDSDNKALGKAWRTCFSEANMTASLVNHEKNTGSASPQSNDDNAFNNAELKVKPVLVPGFNDCLTKDSNGSKQQPPTLYPNSYHTDSWTVCTHGETVMEVAVGVSQLHLVKLPALQMMPIYWSPIHDIAAVTRGTWFYKDSMCPVEPAIANRLELGYIKNSPWCDGWSDRLRSAIEEGISGYQRFHYKLWQEDEAGELDSSDNLFEACKHSPSKSHCYTENFLRGEFSAVGRETSEQGDNQDIGAPAIIKAYSGSVVCYKDSKNAFILKPGLHQSYYYSFQSLSKILGGGSVGIHVVRGFDRQAWEHLHPSKKLDSTGSLEVLSPINTDGLPSSMETSPPEVTDLVFVVHGIGQKLSQRLEGFHFTHAINSLRRSINTDLSNPMVRKALQINLGGIAVLPINWRSTFSFEDGRSIIAEEDGKAIPGSGGFALDDITPDTIPAVRSLISDVLLDIPFYMSSHKAKMIEAVVKEANRIYRLWCHNNPGFKERGRVHIIGHSLGTALTLDILSQQPTFVTPFDARGKIGTKHFEFDTKNVFFVGSPVGFFLLLGGGKLMPRRGRGKPDLGLDDENSKDVTGREGTYGCMAADNLYNVLHPNDPIAYRLNAAVDIAHAKSLKKVEVPSTVANFFDTVSSVTRTITQGISKFAVKVDETNDPLTSYLSSQDETTRQYISNAEKMFYLLNDNGQVDYFLKPGDGPDIQYLNMLWAHTSYWTNADFVRMLVTEIGREPGQRNVSARMEAVKVPLQD